MRLRLLKEARLDLSCIAIGISFQRAVQSLSLWWVDLVRPPALLMFSHNQHGTVSMTDNLLRGAAQQHSVESGAAMSGDDDQFHMFLLCQTDNLAKWFADADQ